MSGRGRNTRLFGCLLLLYPRIFRDRFGREMLDLFEEQLRLAGGSRSARRRVWIRAASDVCRSAIRERLGGRIDVVADRRVFSSFLEGLGRDLRYALMMMRKTPAFTATALATLALCLGAALAIFAVVDAILLRPLPFPGADRLVTVFNTYPRAGVADDGASLTNYYERRGSIAAFESLSLYRDDAVVVGEPGAAEREFVTRVSPEFFATLGVEPAMGRAFTEAETDFQNDHRAIVTDGYWRQQLNHDPQAVGRTIRVNRTPFTVVGVLPQTFQFLSSKRRIYLPLSSRPGDRSAAWRHSGSSSHMIARLKSGVPIGEAQAQVDAHNATVEADDPNAQMIADTGFRSLVMPLHASHVAAVRPTLILLQAGVLFLLLIGIVNVANLLLIRTTGRTRELAVRRAIGATPAQIVGTLLIETMLLSAIGGAMAVAVASGGIRLLAVLGAGRLPLGANIALDSRSAIVACAGAIAAGLSLVLPAAWYHLRSETAGGLNSASRSSTDSRGVRRVGHVFVIAQIALAFVLLSGTGLLATSLRHILAVPPGFDAANVLTGQISLTRYGTEASRLAFLTRMMQAIAEQPGVAAVGVSTNVPLSGNANKSSATVEGRPPSAEEPQRANYAYAVGGSYFAAMGIPVLEGRLLSAGDLGPDSHVCVVDESFARRHWPHGGAVGRRLFVGSQTGPDAEAFTIVGVAGDVKQAALSDEEALGAVYYPYSNYFDSAIYIVVRGSGSVEAIEAMMRKTVRGMDPELPLNNLRTMDARIADSLIVRRSPAMLAAVFSALALLLTVLGTYGVLSYSVAQRRREIALRVALGARPADVRGQFTSLAMRLLAAGAAIGTTGAWLTGRAMRGLLFHVPPLPVATLAATFAIVACVCVAACLLPSRRAASIPPIDALRGD